MAAYLYRRSGFLFLRRTSDLDRRAYSSIERAYVRQFARELDYKIEESARFLLVSPRRTAARLATAENTLRVLKKLPLFSSRGAGRFVVYILAPPVFERYTKLIDSSYIDLDGLYVERGLGHLVIRAGRNWQKTLAHELTHAGYQHLPLPVWLGEGLASHAEGRAGREVRESCDQLVALFMLLEKGPQSAADLQKAGAFVQLLSKRKLLRRAILSFKQKMSRAQIRLETQKIVQSVLDLDRSG